ncbi:MAG TPA: hypothetical protein VKH82_10695 [Candidatus Binatia bacterium]|nr:hypothetical protein [Candidatus Binatia bacterium]
MGPPPAPTVRLPAVVAFAAYTVLAHVALTRHDTRWASAGLAILAWGVLWDALSPVPAAIVSAAAVAIVSWLVPALPDLVIHGSPVVINVFLCVLFGLTLRRGHEPLITRFARLEHDVLPPQVERYTRRLTVLWTLFFAVMAIITVALWLAASRTAFSLFVNVINWVLLAAFLIGEYLYRRVRFPTHEHKPPHTILRRFGASVRTSRQRSGT